MPKVKTDEGRSLDATVSVSSENGAVVLHFESRGRGREDDYAQGLELLFSRLVALGVVIADAFVANRETQGLSAAERRIEVDGYPLPIDPSALGDISRFRAAFGSAHARAGRRLGTGGSGNATQRVHLLLGFKQEPRSIEDLQRYLEGPARATNYWAFCANPDIYRISDAVQSLETDSWTTNGSRVARGDWAIIWQAQGRGDRRGVVALAEVVGDPAPASDAGNPFWVDQAAPRPVEERVRVRYLTPPGLPLWLNEPSNEFLHDLSVAKGQGTVFHVRSEQWGQVVSAAGGRYHISAEGSAQEQDAALTRGAGQGRLPVAEREAVEHYAMERATAYFTALHFHVKPVNLKESYDLHCTKDGRELYVEIKGTTGQGKGVFLTFNEVEIAENHFPDTALFITSEIELDRTRTPPKASQGRDKLVMPWRASPGSLKVVEYRYSLSANEGFDVTEAVTLARAAHGSSAAS